MAHVEINQPSDLFREFRYRAKKSFGQHFLVNPEILHNLVDEAGVEPGDSVLEIGPGCGTLTWVLLERGAAVTAVEAEHDAARFLRDVDMPGDLEIVERDFLRVDLDDLLDARPGPWRSVSNLPFGSATEIYFRLAESFDRFESLVLMFQREVADRMVASAGDDAFGRLSLTAQLYADLEVVQTLAPGAFDPAPEVHAAALRVDPVEGTRIADPDVRETFVELVRTAFQHRRKILPNALASLDVEKDLLEDLMASVGLKRTIRPERVDFEQWVELARAVDDPRNA